VSDKALAVQVDGWLEILQISTVIEWDVLVFVHRHGSLLVKAETIALLVGYDKDPVGKALDNLVSLVLVRRSRSSQGVRFYRFDVPLNSAVEQSTEQLFGLTAERAGRLMVTRRLVVRAQRIQSPARAGLRLA
jgi:hypothetical protein